MEQTSELLLLHNFGTNTKIKEAEDKKSLVLYIQYSDSVIIKKSKTSFKNFFLVILMVKKEIGYSFVGML